MFHTNCFNTNFDLGFLSLPDQYIGLTASVIGQQRMVTLPRYLISSSWVRVCLSPNFVLILYLRLITIRYIHLFMIVTLQFTKINHTITYIYGKCLDLFSVP